LEEAIEQIKIRTRRFAKQQRTWIRRFRTRQPSVWLDADENSTQGLADNALAAILVWLGEPSIRINHQSTAAIDRPQASS
jgi:hypothetical protein